MNCLIYHAQCIYTPNPKMRAPNNPQKSSSRTKKRKQQSRIELASGRQGIEAEPENPPRGDQSAVEQTSSLPDDAVAQQREPTPSYVWDEGVETLLQQHDAAQFHADSLHALEMGEIGEINGMNIDDFGGMADFFGGDNLQRGAPSSLGSPVDGTSQRISIPQDGEMQMDSEIPDDEGIRKVLGLQFFMSESRLSPDTAGLKSIPPGLEVEKDSMSAKFIGM
jgi:hypothetical protein